jgi:hypothetical protein
MNRAATRDELVVEEYDADRDSFTLIWKRATDGHFKVEYLVKGKAASDPQWSLPLWGNISRSGIFGTQEDARAHVNAIADDYHRTYTGA